MQCLPLPLRKERATLYACLSLEEMRCCATRHVPNPWSQTKGHSLCRPMGIRRSPVADRLHQRADRYR